jgi:hypothetical protein
MENKNDTAKLAADIEVLKFQIQCLQRENNAFRIHNSKRVEDLAGCIVDTNTRITKVVEYAKQLSADMYRDGRVTLNHLMRLEETVEQLQANIMPTVTAFENEVANIIGAPAYDARERPHTTPSARAGAA